MVDRHSILKPLILASALCVICITSARAEVACAPLAAITKSLAEKFHESPTARAIADHGVTLIVFAAEGGATWTLVGVRAEHAEIGCMLGSGTDWQALKASLPGRPS